jgi:hypothetical protein
MIHKFLIFLIILTGLNNPTFAQAEQRAADSLFLQKKYTEAFDQYVQIYQGGQASSAMLQKMAFIQEGLGNYVTALYYLNRYYNLTANKKVLAKMRAIAEEQNLSGYEYSDVEFFQNFLFRYNKYFVGILVALSILLLAYIYRKKKLNEPIGFAGTFYVLVLAALFLISNQFFVKDRAIIKDDQSVLMTGPSAGAEPIDIISKGHRVTILAVTPAWVKIQWHDQEAYIRNNKLIII